LRIVDSDIGDLGRRLGNRRKRDVSDEIKEERQRGRKKVIVGRERGERQRVG